MQMSIGQGLPPAEAVERHYPNGLYHLLVQQAKAEAAAVTMKLARQADAGRHLWD